MLNENIKKLHMYVVVYFFGAVDIFCSRFSENYI